MNAPLLSMMHNPDVMKEQFAEDLRLVGQVLVNKFKLDVELV